MEREQGDIGDLSTGLGLGSPAILHQHSQYHPLALEVSSLAGLVPGFTEPSVGCWVQGPGLEEGRRLSRGRWNWMVHGAMQPGMEFHPRCSLDMNLPG